MARIFHPPRWLLVMLLVLAFLAIYIRTAAPGLLSGDSAEFQLAAVTLGVAHPTTYPLYTVLGYLATQLIPFGEPAWRVTLVSAICAAFAVGLQCLLALRLGVSRRGAFFAAALLGVTPGLWNAATLAEVYALLALLIVTAVILMTPRIGRHGLKSADDHLGLFPQEDTQRNGFALPILRSNAHPKGTRFHCFTVGLIAGLGFTHHGLFGITVLPLCVVWVLRKRRSGSPRPANQEAPGHIESPQTPGILYSALCALGGFGLGFIPWLYPLVQYARLGPFTGEDYGLPRHYYWGAPTTWGEVLDLLTGGTVRRGIFRIPSGDQALAIFNMLAERALFEFGWFALLLALLGSIMLWRRSRAEWLASCWVLLATTGYLILLGPAVADAPIFTLPMLIPIALWASFGIDALLWLGIQLRDTLSRKRGASQINLPSIILTLLLIVWLGWWADTRVEYASKRHLTLYRTFGEAVLQILPADAVVLAHWEQGMTLQYLRLADHERPDVWVDVVEPSDEAWGKRIRRRYAGREVFLIGQAPDVEGLPVELVREDDYAQLFHLRQIP